METMKRSIFKFTIFVFLIVACFLIFDNLSFEILKNYIESHSKFSAVIYILSWIILPIFMFPAAILALLGGAFFGVAEGLVLTMIGVGINSVIMYFMGKFLGKDFLANFFDISKFKTSYIKDEFFTIFLLRLIPIIPYNAINYFAGAFAFRFWRFFWGSFFGKVLSSIVFLNLGVNASNVGTTQFWWAVFWVFVLVLVSIVLKLFYAGIFKFVTKF
ncbi:hypothetical protein CFT85387_02465 [Campylobacter fetus subsp. testudinum]|nr:hypothetical protein CFT12S02847_05400 [Campylobacter fetus subsp. testudinum]OCS02054.1 hypothetical protein CFT85387_02465 [Campylobacter fetus subsp. testudinum]